MEFKKIDRKDAAGNIISVYMNANNNGLCHGRYYDVSALKVMSTLTNSEFVPVSLNSISISNMEHRVNSLANGICYVGKQLDDIIASGITIINKTSIAKVEVDIMNKLSEKEKEEEFKEFKNNYFFARTDTGFMLNGKIYGQHLELMLLHDSAQEDSEE